MKGAIASVEIYARREDQPIQRWTLVVTEPSFQPSQNQWACRVALADRHRPEVVAGRDSIEALDRALVRGRQWLRELHAEGFLLYRDRGAREPYDADGQ